MTDRERLPDPMAAVSALPRGSAVILRHYGAADREAMARRLAVLCRRHGIRLLVGADPRLAVAVGAGGVHWPEAMARRGLARGRRPGWLVTAAAHSPAALLGAARAGADAVLVSPVFATQSHPGAPPLGALRFAILCRSSPVPVYALGGVTAANARRLVLAGAAGLAGIGGFGETAPR